MTLLLGIPYTNNLSEKFQCRCNKAISFLLLFIEHRSKTCLTRDFKFVFGSKQTLDKKINYNNSQIIYIAKTNYYSGKINTVVRLYLL